VDISGTAIDSTTTEASMRQVPNSIEVVLRIDLLFDKENAGLSQIQELRHAVFGSKVSAPFRGDREAGDEEARLLARRSRMLTPRRLRQGGRRACRSCSFRRRPCPPLSASVKSHVLSAPGSSESKGLRSWLSFEAEFPEGFLYPFRSLASKTRSKHE